MLPMFMKARGDQATDPASGPVVRPDYWFVRKTTGIGATPANAKGWAATMLFVAALGGMQIFVHDHRARIAVTISFTLIFTVISWLKTDGGWGWQWRGKNKR